MTKEILKEKACATIDAYARQDKGNLCQHQR